MLGADARLMFWVPADPSATSLRSDAGTSSRTHSHRGAEPLVPDPEHHRAVGPGLRLRQRAAHVEWVRFQRISHRPRVEVRLLAHGLLPPGDQVIAGELVGEHRQRHRQQEREPREHERHPGPQAQAVKSLAHRLHHAILARTGPESGASGGPADRRPRNLPVVDPDLQARYTAEGRAITYWAGVAPERPAITTAHGVRTFAELDDRADQLVRALRARGLTAGDAVALVSRNRPEFVEVWAACRRAGFRLTPLNWHLTVDEMSYIVSDCEARALVVDLGVPSATALAERHAATLAALLTIDGTDSVGERYDAVLDAQPSGPITDPTPGTLMLYTSGTTGRPKGVRKQPHPPAVDNLAGYEGDSVHLCTGPLYHAAPLNISMISPLSNGAGVVAMDGWTAVETLQLVAAHHVTHTHMVPTMFHRLLALDAETRDRYDVSSLRLVVHGAAPCPIAVKRAMIEWLGPVIVEYYASTEGAGTLVDSTTWLARTRDRRQALPRGPDHRRRRGRPGRCPPARSG